MRRDILTFNWVWIIYTWKFIEIFTLHRPISIYMMLSGCMVRCNGTVWGFSAIVYARGESGTLVCVPFFDYTQLSTFRIMAACRLGFDEVYYLYVYLSHMDNGNESTFTLTWAYSITLHSSEQNKEVLHIAYHFFSVCLPVKCWGKAYFRHHSKWC